MMIDRVIEQHPWTDTISLRECKCFLVDNVAEYLENSGHTIIDKDIPNAAPPFEEMWFEHKPVRRLHKCIPELKRIGLHVVVNDKEAELLQDPSIQERYSELLKSPEIKWVLMATPFWEARDGTIQHIEAFSVLLIMENGKVELGERDKPIGFTLKGKPESIEWIVADCFAAFWLVPLLSISFMHCKNVEIIAKSPSERLQKSRIKKRKKPFLEYHVLNIKPMHRIIEGKGKSAELGLKRALHICRGHFKDFTKRGLFGKLYGLYWWDSQVRGDIKEGIVQKDYRVYPPEEENKK